MPATDSPSTPVPSTPVVTPNQMWAIAVGLSSLYGVPMLCLVAFFLWAGRSWGLAALALGVPLVLGGVCGFVRNGLTSVVVTGLVLIGILGAGAFVLGAALTSAAAGASSLLSVLFWAFSVSPLYLLAAWPFQGLRRRSE